MNDLAYSDALKELYLEHHGVKGQKHGVRRGPPYPLGSDKKGSVAWKKLKQRISRASKKRKKAAAKKEEESDDKIREKLLKSVDAKYIYKHRSLLDDRELQGRIDRINKEATLKKLAQPEDQLYNKAQKGKNWLRTAADMTKAVSDMYTAANVIKSISEKGVNSADKSNVTINIGGKKDNKKKDKK